MWETKTVHTIEYREFDKLVKDTFGIKYEIVANEELHNDMTWSLGSVPSDYWGEYGEKLLARVLAGGKEMYSSLVLAHELVRRGVIPPGNWQVTVCW